MRMCGVSVHVVDGMFKSHFLLEFARECGSRGIQGAAATIPCFSSTSPSSNFFCSDGVGAPQVGEIALLASVSLLARSSVACCGGPVMAPSTPPSLSAAMHAKASAAPTPNEVLCFEHKSSKTLSLVIDPKLSANNLADIGTVEEQEFRTARAVPVRTATLVKDLSRGG